MIKIRNLLTDIANRDIVLPEFQREYVWGLENSKKLMMSLLKEYPVGSVLLWKTATPPQLRNFPASLQQGGTFEVLLDGQQRLTTLYLLTRNELPPYYTPRDITHDPRDLFFNLEDGDFQYYHPTSMQNPIWVRVTDCFQKPPAIFAIARQNADTDGEISRLAELYQGNLNRLKYIEDIQLPTQIVPQRATINEAIEIFDNVNSAGTRLIPADLALTHITGRWGQVRQVMKQKVDVLTLRNFPVGLDFLTRALTVVVTDRAMFPAIHHRELAETVQGWEHLSKILDYLMSVLPEHGYIHSLRDLTTLNVLIPVIAYLNKQGGHFPTQKSRNGALQWLYYATIWARYSAQTDQLLEADIKTAIDNDSPWDALEQELAKKRGGTVKVAAGSLDFSRSANPFYPMLLILAKAQGAVDWFTGAPLASSHVTKDNRVPLFSKVMLENAGYRLNESSSADYQVHRKAANQVFLSSGATLMQGRLPEEILADVQARYPGALEAQCIPLDPELWRVENFGEFLNTRRELLVQRLNDYLESLSRATNERRPVDLAALLRDEGQHIERKATFTWSMNESKKDDIVIHTALKTIAAFLNSEGGTLLLGVKDDGSINGLSYDLQNMPKGLDEFELQLSNRITNAIGNYYLASFVRIQFETVEDQQICLVFVEKSTRPAFLTFHKDKDAFYVRTGNSSRQLNLMESHEYVRKRWPV